MQLRMARKILGVLVGGMLFLMSCTQSVVDKNVYSVVVPYILSKFDPHHNNVNIQHFINMHMYYPLFQYDDYGVLHSSYLDMSKTRATDSSFRKYSLCLRDDVKFSDGTAITVADLELSLRSTHSVQMNLVSIEKIQSSNGGCVQLELEKADHLYFDKLTTVQSAVLKNENDRDLPIGYGPYKIVAKRDNEILALESDNKDVDFKRIEFIVASSPSQLQSTKITDWNHSYLFSIPEDVKKKSVKVKRRLLKTYNLLVDYRDSEVRRVVGACLLENGITGFFPMLSIEALSGFVPVGIDGSFEDFSLRSIFGECPKNKISKKVKLVCTGEKICSGMRRFVSEKAAVLPFVISLQEIDAKSYSKAFFADEEHIMMLGLDSVDTEASTFYSIFLGKDRYGHVSFEHLKGLIGIAAKSDDKVFKKKTNEDIQRKILATGIILPLGQVVVDQYYPKYISNIRIINKTSGFPQIDQFKIR